jgi:hypothetical protein
MDLAIGYLSLGAHSRRPRPFFVERPEAGPMLGTVALCDYRVALGREVPCAAQDPRRCEQPGEHVILGVRPMQSVGTTTREKDIQQSLERSSERTLTGNRSRSMSTSSKCKYGRVGSIGDRIYVLLPEQPSWLAARITQQFQRRRLDILDEKKIMSRAFSLWADSRLLLSSFILSQTYPRAPAI